MAKNYINDNNRWKQKGASMVEKAYGPSGFFDKVGDAISGVANTVGNVANTVGNALTGGGNDPQPSAGGGGGGGLGGLFPGLRERIAAMRANAQNQMGMPGQGGDGQEVTVRGRIINDQFRPHFRGGFGANMKHNINGPAMHPSTGMAPDGTPRKPENPDSREKNVMMSKMNRKGKKQVKETGMYDVFSGEKDKMVSRQRAERMKKRGWYEQERM